MKKKKSMGVGWSILLLSFMICLIAIFIPDGLQGPALFLALMTWNVWVVSAKLVPYIRFKAQQKAIKDARKEELSIQHSSTKTRAMENCLLLHVNHRITECLHKIYPNATWLWTEKEPMNLILQSGIGRIRVNGVEDYDYADIKIERNGTISCSMVKQMPQFRAERKTDACSPMQQPLNPQIWYEKQGRAVLQSVITDLHSRGHGTLTISEEGKILIQENEESVTHDRLENFPAKNYWTQLVQVFQRDGLAARIEPTGLQLTW